MKRKTESKTARKEQIAANWAATFLYPTIAIYNRAATDFSVLPRTIAVRTGLGAGASTSTKNHPLSEKEKGGFVNLVPGGIACPLTIWHPFIALEERRLANIADLCYNIPTV